MEKTLTDAPSEQEVAEVLYGLSAFKELHFIVRRLAFERDRLRTALKKANDQAEHFEREWYLRGDELERLRADAERYRFIRTRQESALYADLKGNHVSLDAAIDAARGVKPSIFGEP